MFIVTLPASLTCGGNFGWEVEFLSAMIVSNLWSQADNGAARHAKQHRDGVNKEFAEVHQPRTYPVDVGLGGDDAEPRCGCPAQ